MQQLAATFFEPPIPSGPRHGAAECWPKRPSIGASSCRGPALPWLDRSRCPFRGEQASEGAYIAGLELTFHVSRDEEYVRLFLLRGGELCDLGERAHNYLLYLLASRRLADRDAGMAESACGWVDRDEWEHDPSLTPGRINLDVCRSRRQFSRLGLLDPHNIVERRLRTGQLRVGVARLTVVRI